MRQGCRVLIGSCAMPRVDELELPRFDYTDPAMRGERFHSAMRDLRAQGRLPAEVRELAFRAAG